VLLALLCAAGCSDGDDGADRERDRLVEIIADNMRTAGLDVADSDIRCVAEAVVERVGVDRLRGVGDADDFAALDDEVKDDMVDAASEAIADCGVEVDAGVGG
jgi:hypothetical protein